MIQLKIQSRGIWNENIMVKIIITRTLTYRISKNSLQSKTSKNSDTFPLNLLDIKKIMYSMRGETQRRIISKMTIK